MAKVFGSETSSMIVDNCMQIFGGYGFIEEYPIAMAYRDDRINQIWEGTNEINRAIITGYMMKNVLMEKISLTNILNKPKDIHQKEIKKKDIFFKEKIGVDASKRLVILIFHEALCEFGQDLKHEQQLSEAIADMLTYLYTCESVICRAQQALSSSKASSMIINIVRVNISESVIEINTLALKCLNHIFSKQLLSLIHI